MHTLPSKNDPITDKAAFYRSLMDHVNAMLQGERDWIANTANTAAILFHSLSDINWAGFYFLKSNELVLGPFQGKPACVRIGPGRGVCGAAVVQRRILVVPDVHAFPGHIACDSASNSEIVLPIFVADQVIGVLDIDSPIRNRFDEHDATGLQAVVTSLLAHSDAPQA